MTDCLTRIGFVNV